MSVTMPAALHCPTHNAILLYNGGKCHKCETAKMLNAAAVKNLTAGDTRLALAEFAMLRNAR